jgi:dTMP kinase
VSAKLIAFCGIDGCGKSTQLNLLSLQLSDDGISHITTRQPTTMYRENPLVRAYLDDGEDSLGQVGLALFAAADRQYHVRTSVLPALETGIWVLTDRYVFSTYAFFQARGLGLPFLKTINPTIPTPDLTVLLDLPASVAVERAGRRDAGQIKYEERSLEFMETVRANFLALASPSFMILDAMEEEDGLASKILSAVRSLQTPTAGESPSGDYCARGLLS